jgi:MFS family permease
MPWLIKRNMILLALALAFGGAGMQYAYGFGPLMIVQLTGSAGLAGVSVAIIGASRFAIAYPIGKITDTYGRRLGVVMGLVLAIFGAVALGLSMGWKSPVLFVAGLFVFGMGMNASQQLRVAAADMAPPRMRAQALGYVALGSLVGVVSSPIIVSISEKLAPSFKMEPLALAWMILPVLIVTGIVLISFVRPDPKEIGMNLSKYYPGYTPPPRTEAKQVSFSPMQLWRNPASRIAIVSNCSGQGNMSIVMVLTSLVLSHHGHSLSAIAFSHMFHSIGMFAFTVPLGKLADRFGRRYIMYPGVAVALLGAAMVSFTDGNLIAVTVGTFLVGVGWAGSNVASTALIADMVETHERGRAIGVNDSAAAFISVLTALVTGPLIELWGLNAAGAVAVLLAVPPLVMFIYRIVRGNAPV